MAIASLVYKITADTRNFDKNVKTTRRELNAAKRVMNETKPPVERLKLSMQGLERLYERGVLDIHSYRRAQAQLRLELTKSRIEAAGLNRQMLAQVPLLGRLSGSLGPATVAMAALAIEVAAVKKTFDITNKAMTDFDRIHKKALTLGTDFATLDAMQLAAERAGVEIATIDKSLQFLQRRIGEAVRQPEGTAADLFAELEIAAHRLQRLDIADQFTAVSQAIGALGSEAQQADFAQQLLGRGAADLKALLPVVGAEFARARQDVEDFRGSIGENFLRENAGTLDALEDLKRILDGLAGGFARVIGPILRNIAEIQKLLSRSFGAGTLGAIIATIVKDQTGLGALGFVVQRPGAFARVINARSDETAIEAGVAEQRARISAALTEGDEWIRRLREIESNTRADPLNPDVMVIEETL